MMVMIPQQFILPAANRGAAATSCTASSHEQSLQPSSVLNNISCLASTPCSRSTTQQQLPHAPLGPSSSAHHHLSSQTQKPDAVEDDAVCWPAGFVTGVYKQLGMKDLIPN
jgi:hypothetical protein